MTFFSIIKNKLLYKTLSLKIVIILSLIITLNNSNSKEFKKDGEKLFKLHCSACHSVKRGEKDKVGPNLYGVYGSTAGTQSYSFQRRYSSSIKQSNVVWDTKSLDLFLKNPRDFIPKTKMTFVGLRKISDRTSLIKYLRNLNQ